MNTKCNFGLLVLSSLLCTMVMDAKTSLNLKEIACDKTFSTFSRVCVISMVVAQRFEKVQ